MRLGDSRLIKRHIDHVKSRFLGTRQDRKEKVIQGQENSTQQQCEEDGLTDIEGLREESEQTTNHNPQLEPQADLQQEGMQAQLDRVLTGLPTTVTRNLGGTGIETLTVRCSTRVRKPLVKLDL